MGFNLRALPRTLREDISKSRQLLRPANWKTIFRSQRDAGKERYRRAALTGAASIIQRGLTIIISLVSVPLTIHYLGPEQYGVWLTISSILVWLALTDFGLAGSALINVVSEAHGRNDKRTAQQYVSSAVWSLVVIAFVLGLITFVCFRYISWTAVFHSTTIPPHELATAAALTLIFFIVSLPLSIQYSVYSAYQDGALSNVCGIIMNVSSLIALVLVTRSSGGLVDLICAVSGTRLIIGFGNTLYIFKRYPWLVPAPSAVRWSCIHKLLSLGSNYLVTQLGAFGIGQSQPFIITQILGPAAVVPFVVSYRLITLPMEVVYLSIAPFVPAFGEAKARDDWHWIRTAYRKVTVISILVGIPILLLLAAVAQPVIRLWAGPAAVPSWLLILGLVLYNIVGVMFMGTGQLLTGLERPKPLVASTVLCAVSVIGLGIIGCKYMGVAGVALAMAASKLLTFWPIQFLAARKIFLTEHAVPEFVTNEEVA
jgi:O-antigen/teichoic acid export membrane protein